MQFHLRRGGSAPGLALAVFAVLAIAPAASEAQERAPSEAGVPAADARRADTGAATQRGPAARMPFAARDLPRGTSLSAEDISFAPLPDGAEPPQRSMAQIGWVTRRVVSEGEPLLEPTVAPPTLIRSGQTVQAVWRQGDLELRMSGRAMGSAKQGERIRVRIDARRRVEGTAVGPALVRIDSAQERG